MCNQKKKKKIANCLSLGCLRKQSQRPMFLAMTLSRSANPEKQGEKQKKASQGSQKHQCRIRLEAGYQLSLPGELHRRLYRLSVWGHFTKRWKGADLLVFFSHHRKFTWQGLGSLHIRWACGPTPPLQQATPQLLTEMPQGCRWETCGWGTRWGSASGCRRLFWSHQPPAWD